MTTNVLPILRIKTPNGEYCDINVYHITMIDCRQDIKGYIYPTVCLSNGLSIAITEEEAQRISEAITKHPVQERYEREINNCKFQKNL